MKQDELKNNYMQQLERDTKASIREKLLALPHHQKLNLGLLAREPSIPDTAIDISECIRMFADGIVMDMFNNTDTRMAALERLMLLPISLMHIVSEKEMRREITEKLERIPFDILLHAGIFGKATTPEMAEQHLQNLVEWRYQGMMKEGIELTYGKHQKN